MLKNIEKTYLSTIQKVLVAYTMYANLPLSRIRSVNTWSLSLQYVIERSHFLFASHECRLAAAKAMLFDIWNSKKDSISRQSALYWVLGPVFFSLYVGGPALGRTTGCPSDRYIFFLRRGETT